MARLIISRKAEINLRTLRNYLNETSPAAAKKVIGEIRKAFHRIAEVPGAGHIRKELSNPSVLVYNVYSYLILYERRGNTVEILAVRHGARELDDFF